MAKENSTDLQPPLIDQSGRPSAITRLIILMVVLTGAAILFSIFRKELGDPFLLGLLGVLAMIGVGYLFATAIGFVHFMPRSASDDLSKAFVDSMGHGLLVTDQRGKVFYVNRAYADLTDAATGVDVKTVEALLSDTPEASAVIQKLSDDLRDGKSGDGEIRLTAPIKAGADLGPRWYRVRARPLRVPDFRQPLSAWELADVSHEREEQERFFLDLQKAIDHLDQAPAGFFSADQAGRITYLNATLAGWLGIDLAGFVPGGLRLQDIVAGDGMALVRAVKADPGSTRNSVFDLDLSTSSGKALPVRFMHRVSASKGGVGGPSRTIVLNRTQGEDASAELRAAEVRFTRFFNSTPMAIASVDSQGRIVRTNAPFLSLFSSVVDSDAVTRRIRLDSVIHERDRPSFAAAIEKAEQRQADIDPIDTTLAGNDERHLRVYVNAIADGTAGGDSEEAAIVYAVDTTEQKAFENQMAQTQKMQAVGRFAGGIAHDFNNVLTVIMMASDQLLLNHRASDPSFPDIMQIKQNANRAAALVRQLLAYSRKQTLRAEVLNLVDVMADLRMLLVRLVGNGVKLSIEHGRDLWPVSADIGQLEQVIVNLAANARDAMPEGGSIIIQTKNVAAQDTKAFGYRELAPADYVMIEFQDTGSGMEPEVKEKIFEPFFTTKEVGKGTGLGLSTVYGIIKQSGGSIFCDSEIGKGTTFRIFLPRLEAAPAAAGVADENSSEAPVPAMKQPETAKDLSGSETILLVEDEDGVRMSGVKLLRSRGYTVHEASSGVEALELFEEHGDAIDMIVSDVVMPEMDGPTLLGEVRKLRPDVKFVFVSGYAEDAFAKNLPADQQFGFLPKPFTLKQLATVVRETLDSEKIAPMPSIKTIGFDADDTLWQNLSFYRLTEERFQALLADHADPERLGQALLETERRNLKRYGFGIKGFTLSMIETALEVTEGRAPGSVISQIVEAGREMLAHPVDLLPHAREAIEALHGTYRLVLITKGDLFDQERKIAASGLGEFFDAVEIVSDKNDGTYRRIFQRHGATDEAVMVGNSLKSDIVPAIAAGSYGVFVPHVIDWALDHDDEPSEHARFRRIEHLGELAEVIDSISGVRPHSSTAAQTG